MHRSPLTRIAAVLVALSVVFTLAVPASASAVMSPQAIPDFVFNGGGWGHGIGMSQYGAQGYALKGWTAEQIIQHYFQGTTIATSKPVTVRVYLDKDAVPRTRWTVKAVGSPLVVSDGSKTLTLAADKYFVFKNGGTSVTVSDGANVVGTFSGSPWADPQGGALLEILENSGPPLHEDYPSGYPKMRWRGKVQLIRSGSGLHCVNAVSLEEYLYGVVPRESPSSWDADALSAQALVARSYAKAKVDPNDDGILDANLRCTTADQVYGGHSRVAWNGSIVYHEAASTNVAVNATQAKVVKYGSTIVQTFFSSSMGGHTANIEDSWSYSAPKPYYTGVPSPYEALAGCPNQSWTVAMSGLELAAKLKGSSSVTKELADHGLAPVPVGAGSSVAVSSISVDYGVSGYPRWVYFKFSTGRTVKLSAWTVKVALGLKSPNFRPTTFPISRVEGGDRYATSVEICNVAFPGGTAPAVVLASGQDYADALTGSALAGAAGGPLLLTAKDHLPDSVAREVQSLAPSTVYIMGGTAAVSSGVEDSVRSLVPSARIVRLSGANRYDTSVLAAREVRSLSGVTKAIVVSGSAWADGAAISGLAYAKRYPILLTATDSVPGSVSAFFAEAKPASTLIAGGAAVVTGAVATTISDLTGGGVTRLSGADRYYTSSAIARHSVDVEGFGYGQVYLATGAMYADALSGGVLAGVTGQPILLTGIDSCPDGTRAFLRERKAGIEGLTIFGGPSAVSIDGLLALNEAMR